MDLTEEERSWALAIKDALKEEDAELAAQLTDFEYAHHALIAKDQVPKALKRIHRLQQFRKDHAVFTADTSRNAKDMAQEAFSAITQLDDNLPGMFLSFGKDDNGHYLCTWRYSMFLPSKIKTVEDWQICFSAFYYLFDAMHPDFDAIRNGITMLGDCDGMGWRNFSLEFERHAAHLYQDAYPVRFHRMVMLHAPIIFKAMYALMKPFLSQKVKNCIELSATAEDVHRDMKPYSILSTTMGGTQTAAEVKQEILSSLQLRYSNMASFKLY